jgi:hypothetical protein
LGKNVPEKVVDKHLAMWYYFNCALDERFLYLNNWIAEGRFNLTHNVFFGEFDPGSGLTLAVCFMHASRTNHFGD